VSGIGQFHPFSTHEAWFLGVKSKAFNRLIISVFLLDLFPLLFFSKIFIMLGIVSIDVNAEIINFYRIFLVALLSLSSFGFSRIYVGVAVWGWRCLYREEEWQKIRNERVKKFCEKKIDGKYITINKKCEERTVFDYPWSHIIPGICFILLPLLCYIAIPLLIHCLFPMF
jgi:hypothetical protein